ncbi:MAG: 2-phospho-L-lactate transferase [Anaerolineae bacterium]|nr:2-phospho-L-lactate transferase [Anaerolineae bacterium]
MPRRVVALAGGVGGAKLADGLYRALPSDALTVVVNTGDDFRKYGLYVSPDLDTVLYTLAGLAHPVNGWGLADDTRQMIEMMKLYGDEAWFGLGDKDLATNLLRTEALANGQPLSVITQDLARRLGIGATLLPMSDDQVATIVDTVEYGSQNFQEYFVRFRWQPVVKRLEYRGSESAAPAPGVLEALESADLIVICPSNPVLSIEPILQIRQIREALQNRRAPCLCVSPIIAGSALKGPAAKLMAELGMRATAAGVADYYGDLLDGFVIDDADHASSQDISTRVWVSNIVMRDAGDRIRLASELLAWGTELRRGSEVRGQ